MAGRRLVHSMYDLMVWEGRVALTTTKTQGWEGRGETWFMGGGR
jgi:hypothetical protein